MALLRTQRFCCPQRDPATQLVLSFHPEIFHGLCLCSSGLGLAGMLFQALPRHRHGYSQVQCGNVEKLKPAARIGSMVNICCCLGNAGILLRSVLWYSLSYAPLDKTFQNATLPFPRPLCIAVSAWVQFFFTALFCTIFFYAVEAFLRLRPSGGVRSANLYFLLSWGISSLVCFQGILLMSFPSDSRCGSINGLVLFHEVVTYLPLLLALLGNPLLLAKAFCAVTAILRKKTGSYTASERLRKRKVRARFLKITITFTACWLVNIVTELLLLLLELHPEWSGHVRLVQMAALTTWIIAAVLNPFYGMLHSLAFYGWQGWGLDCTLWRSLKLWGPLCQCPRGPPDDDDCGERFDVDLDEGLGEMVVPNLQGFVDYSTSLEFGCSAMEVDAVRLLGASRKTLSTNI
ncbi:G-protein coupled receptor 143-like [Lissotriton helveticus]